MRENELRFRAATLLRPRLGPFPETAFSTALTTALRPRAALERLVFALLERAERARAPAFRRGLLDLLPDDAGDLRREADDFLCIAIYLFSFSIRRYPTGATGAFASSFRCGYIIPASAYCKGWAGKGQFAFGVSVAVSGQYSFQFRTSRQP